MQTYKKIIHSSRFLPALTQHEETELPITLRWGNSEDAEGFGIPVHFDGDPCFCELYFEDDSNLIIELNGRWFYKAPETKFVDLMPAFYEDHLSGSTDMLLRIFAPPATGENDTSTEDGLFNYYYTLRKIPEIHIRTAPVLPSAD